MKRIRHSTASNVRRSCAGRLGVRAHATAKPLPLSYCSQGISPSTDRPLLANNHHSRSKASNVSCRSTVIDAGANSSTVPKRVAIFVEPTPFSYVCGYKNRFRNMIKYLGVEGCEVLVITTGKGVTWPLADKSAYVEQPEEFEGAKVIGALSFGCPFYWAMPLSFALSPRIWSALKKFKPDVVHCSSPGVMVFAAKLFCAIAKLPLVLSYHTHLPKYLPDYKLGFLVPLCWAFVRFLHHGAHLTLATSAMLQEELRANNVCRRHVGIEVWKKGVDSETFHPKFRDAEMRAKLTDGNPSDPLLVYVGRLGHEKNLKFVKGILERLPHVRLAFVGDGPARSELEREFAGTKTVFAGMLKGKALSAAYASADIFMMPSESETLGFVVLEAMASGLPVVAVRAGGIPDIIQNPGVTGFLYPSGDLELATRYVNQLVSNEQLRQQIGTAARAEVSNWDWHAATKHLLHSQYARAVAAAKAQYGRKFANAHKNLRGLKDVVRPLGDSFGGTQTAPAA